MTVPFAQPVTGPRRTGSPIRMGNDRVVLLSTGPSDVPHLQRWMADPLVAGAMGRRAEVHSEERLLDYVSRFDRLLDHILTIHDASTMDPVGFAMVSINGGQRTATVTIAIGERRRGRDTQILLAHAARAIGAWSFETVGLRKLTIQVARDNERTAAWVAQRMTLEAELRDEILMPDGSARTILRYGLLRGEWDELKAWFARRDRTGVEPVIRRTRAPAEPFTGARRPRLDEDA